MKIQLSRILLPASLLLNLALLGAVFWLDRRPMQLVPQPTPPAAATPEPASRPFRWSQLESSNYLVYIANLRGIGCPELTVREIIAADVSDLFAPRRDPLLARLAGGGATPEERGRAEGALVRLRQEEAALLRRLFGLPDPVNRGAPALARADTSLPPARARRPAVEDDTATMPLAFQPVDTNLVSLTADDLQTIDEVRQSFLAALGSNQDVNSPEYLRRWQVAQKQADSLLDGLLGRQLMLKYEDAAESQSVAGKPAPMGIQP